MRALIIDEKVKADIARVIAYAERRVSESKTAVELVRESRDEWDKGNQ